MRVLGFEIEELAVIDKMMNLKILKRNVRKDSEKRAIGNTYFRQDRDTKRILKIVRGQILYKITRVIFYQLLCRRISILSSVYGGNWKTSTKPLYDFKGRVEQYAVQVHEIFSTIDIEQKLISRSLKLYGRSRMFIRTNCVIIFIRTKLCDLYVTIIFIVNVFSTV